MTSVAKHRRRPRFGTVMIAGSLVAASALSIYFRFFVGVHPLSPVLIPSPPPGDERLRLADLLMPGDIHLRSSNGSWRIEGDGQDSIAVRAFFDCKVNFVNDFDRHRKFNQSAGNWIEVVQHGRTLLRVYPTGFIARWLPDRTMIVYAGCPDLGSQLARFVEHLKEWPL